MPEDGRLRLTLKNMLKANKNRVLIKRLEVSEQVKSSGFLVSGQLKAGENCFIGEIIDPSDSGFEVGQVVYYSEYSAAAVYPLDKEKSYSEILRNPLYVVACDDIMAYQDDPKPIK